MIETNRFDPVFGPAAAMAGFILLFAGAAMAIFAWTGLPLTLFGAILAFTRTETTIDINNRRARHFIRLAGLVKTGKWKDITSDMYIGNHKTTKTYRSYSRSNRVHETVIKSTIIWLFDSRQKPLLPLRKIKQGDDVQNEQNRIARALSLKIRD